MQKMEEIHMKYLVAGQNANGWCFAAGVVGVFSIATGGLGLLVWGPPAVGLAIACFA